MSLNVGSLFEPDWAERRHEVVAQITTEAPDVICLQEVWKGQSDAGLVDTATWIANQAGVPHHVFGGHGFGRWADLDPSFRFGSAILSRWPIEQSHLWRLPVADDPDDPLPAAMPWELLHARTAGLDLYTTHLAPAPTHGRHRQVQVEAIDELIRSTRGEQDEHPENFGQRAAMPAILTGDFNAEPDSDEVRFLKGLTVLNDRTTFFQDAWAVAGDGGPGFTNDWTTHPLSAGLNVHRKRIDYILVGDPFRRVGDAGRVIDCRVVANQPITEMQASDHAGLVADIVWPDRPLEEDHDG